MKKLFFTTVAFTLGILGTAFAMEKTETEFFYMGRDMKLENTVYTENNAYYIPLRECAEQINATVEYIPHSKIVIEVNPARSVTYDLNSATVSVNGVKPEAGSVKNINGVSYVEAKQFYMLLGYEATEQEENGKKTLRIAEYGSQKQKYHHSNFDTSLSLLQAIEKNQNGAVCPISVKLALAMVANGATGQTQQEILKTLGYQTIEQLNQFVAETMAWKVTEMNGDYYKKDNDSLLCFANGLWRNSSLQNADFSENFKNRIKNFQAVSGTVTTDTALQVINAWVKQMTQGMIPEIITDANFETALINTAYFKCTWLQQFQEENNTKGTFYNIDNTQSEIDFMNQTENFYYCESNGWQMLGIPYSDNNYNFYIFLPEKDNQQPLKDETINRLLQFQEKIKVDVSIPKFSMENSYHLEKTLQTMGINAMFQNFADFNEMYADGNGKVITNALQRVKVVVNEKGTEAAGVTALTMGRGIDMTIPPVFKADRPFTYMLVKDTGNGQKEVLFAGQYVTGK